MGEVRLGFSVPDLQRVAIKIMCRITLVTVLELAEGGELFDKIIEKTSLKKAEAQLHFSQIALTIKYLQLKKICHSDLKTEYMLLCLSDKWQPIVKITDSIL